MTKRANAILFVLFAFLFTAVLSAPVYANSAAPPSFTIVVLNAPDDIGIYLGNGSEKAYKEFSFSDTLFRFYEGRSYTYITVEAEGRKTTVELPEEIVSGYDNYAVLDYKTMELSAGQPWWRAPLLIF